MGLTVARCPSCGADLNLETDRDYFYCPHCGSKILKESDRIVIEHVVRTIDETKIKELEVGQQKFEGSEVLPKKFAMLTMFIVLGMIVLVYNSSTIAVVSIIAVIAFVALKLFGGSKK